MNLYHLTTKNNLLSIKADGLKPMIGTNSQLCKESKKFVYLCDRKSLPYWSKMLALDHAVSIPIDALDKSKLEKFEYDGYSEYTYAGTIDSNLLKYAQIPKLSVEQEKELCLGYIHTISAICREYARCYLNPYDEPEEDLEVVKDYAETITRPSLAVLKRLNFGLLDKADIRKEIRSSAENGEMTLCDLCDFNGDNCRMYQKLNKYPKDDQTKLRHDLYVFIRDTFKGCLSVNTGGYIC